ncbi:MAG: hypothetical protein PF549_03460 [Patescibacteria group bacterium]|jgi:hypothetical protein|nr:hypothetical protein [Patescibacteria group bacterium]
MIKLRNFGKKDKASLENLLKQLLSDSIELEVEKLAKDPNFIGIIAEDNGKVVGFGSLSFFNSIVKKRTGVI